MTNTNTNTIKNNNPALIRYNAEQAAFQAKWKKIAKELREKAEAAGVVID